MDCRIIIDKDCKECVLIYANKDSKILHDIKQFVNENSFELIGYKDKEMVVLNQNDIYCISVINNKVFAVCKDANYQLKQRLYVLESELNNNFVKINQSCIANIKQIERFDASFSGTLKVRFKNGYTDYVSRRQLKTIKQKVGIK